MNDTGHVAAIEAHGKMMKSIYTNSPCLLGTKLAPWNCQVSSRCTEYFFVGIPKKMFAYKKEQKCIRTGD